LVLLILKLHQVKAEVKFIMLCMEGACRKAPLPDVSLPMRSSVADV